MLVESLLLDGTNLVFRPASKQLDKLQQLPAVLLRLVLLGQTQPLLWSGVVFSYVAFLRQGGSF